MKPNSSGLHTNDTSDHTLDTSYSFISPYFTWVRFSTGTAYSFLLLGCPWGQSPFKQYLPSMSKIDKLADGTPRRPRVSHFPFNRADFCGEGTGHFKNNANRLFFQKANLPIQLRLKTRSRQTNEPYYGVLVLTKTNSSFNPLHFLS